MENLVLDSAEWTIGPLASLTIGGIVDSPAVHSHGGAKMPMELSCCAICLGEIALQEHAAVKGCEHSFCVNCILQWASYKSYPWCPQCRLPFSTLLLRKLLDGQLVDHVVEESVCLLLRAPWYTPCEVAEYEAEPSYEEEEEGDEEEEYYTRSLRIGNRRWGENGFVRGGRMEARPVRPAAAGKARGKAAAASSASSSGEKPGMGRRAKRSQKREQADVRGGSSSGGGQEKSKRKGKCVEEDE